MLPSFDLNVADPVTTRYRRTHNTPVRDTEARLNTMYGAWRTILCNSGMEAVNTAFDLIHPGSVIVDEETYFETRNYLQYRGEDVRLISSLGNLDELERVIRFGSLKTPVVICGDSPSTFGHWLPVQKISSLAHRYGAYLMVDNSHVSLYYENPIKDGADICIESYTKYVCGHGDAFAGGIALAPSMQWLDDAVITGSANGLRSIDWILSRRGNVASPFAAYAVSRGLETLAVRMERHTESARWIFNALRTHGVEALYSGCGGLITLPGRGEEFCSRLKRFITIGTFGCTYSCTDFFRSDKAYSRGPCARLSVGLEDPQELLADVMQAISEEEMEC